ncbi:methylmalonyl-CoA mutase, C-terminal domain [Jatrophihabitans endophyticus]|uniref:Methylmalonyl-CoA mutase, C-terminal domain n=1 Tax=Jatrophihabitans endophyticus TaxID=1206085 RepID=A0A1M5Q3W7_9ACTN|nr:cobalamin B12-binding domain-containing protein [Jatrophihabitans endophyticus]SHH08183.1 methylmalonyl-CoA mutase, C-terminal domain [Jatrophihabitans endophyticus]
MTAVQQRAVPIRVMLAKIGLDGHDRGVKVVARTLRDAGMEVIYTGLHRSPDQVVDAAVQEDVDVLGVSLLSGAHMPIFGRIFALLDELPEPHRFVLLAGGVMPEEDEAELQRLGVAAVLGQDTTPETIVATVERLVDERAGESAVR